jgi:hypothetical protein
MEEEEEEQSQHHKCQLDATYTIYFHRKLLGCFVVVVRCLMNLIKHLSIQLSICLERGLEWTSPC